MTEPTSANEHKPFDFSSMPKSIEQQTLDALLRIEVLLTQPPQPAETPAEHAAKIAALQARVPSGRRK